MVKIIKKSYYKNFLFFIVFAFIGLITLVASYAAPAPNAKVSEGESYSSEVDTTIVNDVSASGGSYLQFDASIINGGELFPIIPTDQSILNYWRINSGNPPDAEFTDTEGAFRLICMPSHLAYDDPIVYPGQIGRSHLHMYFGNTLANANSTWNSLRTTGDSTCQSGLLNRSAYWVPALLNGADKVVMPNTAVVYYKGDRESVNLARGLRYIAGFDHANPGQLYGSANPGVPGGSEYHPYWTCDNTGAKFVSIPNCSAGSNIGMIIPFPYCWNGQLDSTNHRDHVIFPTRDPNTGQLGCPSTHATKIPQYTLGVWYSVVSGDNLSNWYLSSDMSSTSNRGTSYHADWFGAWDQGILELWTQECIREMRNCSGANFGDGTFGRQPVPWNWTNPNRLVDIPARP